MNILIFPEYPYPTNHVVVETVFEKLLVKRGHIIHMIRPMKNIQLILKKGAPWSLGSLVVFPDKPISSPVKNILRRIQKRRWVSSAIKEFVNTPLDLILVRNDLVCAREASLLARKKKIPFVFQISSPEAEFRIREARNKLSLKYFYSLLRGYQDLRKRRSLCRQANVVLSISAAMRQYMIEHEDIHKNKIFVFPMGFNDIGLISETKKFEMRSKMNILNKKVLVYSGVIDSIRKPRFMVDILEEVRKRLKDIVLLILTYQVDKRREDFEKYIRKVGAKVEIIGPLSHHDVLGYIQCADVVLSPYHPIYENTICSPTKTIEALGVAVPVVANIEVIEHEYIIRKSQGGIGVRWNVKDFAEAIIYLLENPEIGKKMGMYGRKWVLENRTYEHLTEYLNNILFSAKSISSLKRLPHAPDDSISYISDSSRQLWAHDKRKAKNDNDSSPMGMNKM